MRTVAIPSWQMVGKHFAPVQILISDKLKGKTINGKFVSEETTITITQPSLARVDNKVYSKEFLETVRK
jgi:hypothetical protein